MFLPLFGRSRRFAFAVWRASSAGPPSYEGVFGRKGGVESGPSRRAHFSQIRDDDGRQPVSAHFLRSFLSGAVARFLVAAAVLVVGCKGSVVATPFHFLSRPPSVIIMYFYRPSQAKSERQRLVVQR